MRRSVVPCACSPTDQDNICSHVGTSFRNEFEQMLHCCMLKQNGKQCTFPVKEGAICHLFSLSAKWLIFSQTFRRYDMRVHVLRYKHSLISARAKANCKQQQSLVPSHLHLQSRLHLICLHSLVSRVASCSYPETNPGPYERLVITCVQYVWT